MRVNRQEAGSQEGKGQEQQSRDVLEEHTHERILAFALILNKQQQQKRERVWPLTQDLVVSVFLFRNVSILDMSAHVW